MVARLIFALIGFVFGAFFGLLLWWIFGLGVRYGVVGTALEPNPYIWVKYVGSTCAIIGLLFKDRVGEFVGLGVRSTLEAEAGQSRDPSWYPPTWLVVLLLTAAAVAGWYFAS